MTTDWIDLVIVASLVCLAGTNVFAVVTQPAAGCCGSLQLEKLVVDLTWQQPQSCVLAL